MKWPIGARARVANQRITISSAAVGNIFSARRSDGIFMARLLQHAPFYQVLCGDFNDRAFLPLGEEMIDLETGTPADQTMLRPAAFTCCRTYALAMACASARVPLVARQLK